MSTPAAGIKHAIALITTALDAGDADDEVLIERLAPLLDAVDRDTTINGLLSVACLLAQVAANRGDETPAAVLERVGLAVAVHEAESGPGTFD